VWTFLDEADDPLIIKPEAGEVRIPVQHTTGTDTTDISFISPGDTFDHIEMSPGVEAVGPDDGLVDIVITVTGVKNPYLDFSLWIQ
jgi:hypothetical protein